VACEAIGGAEATSRQAGQGNPNCVCAAVAAPAPCAPLPLHISPPPSLPLPPPTPLTSVMIASLSRSARSLCAARMGRRSALDTVSPVGVCERGGQHKYQHHQVNGGTQEMHVMGGGTTYTQLQACCHVCTVMSAVHPPLP
jgi:hypothetical protein